MAAEQLKHMSFPRCLRVIDEKPVMICSLAADLYTLTIK